MQTDVNSYRLTRYRLLSGSRWLLYCVVALTVSLICAVTGCDKSFQPASSATVSRPPIPLTVNAIQLVRTARTTRTSTFFGTLQPRRTRNLGFSAEGQIKSIVDKFERAKADEVLALLDVSDLDQQRQSLQTTINQSQNQFRDQGTQQLQRQLATIETQIEASQIKAPFDCIVDEIFAIENSLVRPQMPVLRVIDAGTPRVKINLPRRISRLIRPDQEFIFLIEDGTLKGRLHKKAISENPAGSITVWFDVISDLSDIDFVFRESVEARFDFQVDRSGYWLPLTALCRTAEGLWSVFVVVSDDVSNKPPGRIARKLVRIVQLSDALALIDGDFDEGEIVVANGTHRVVPGQTVNTNVISPDEIADASGAAE